MSTGIHSLVVARDFVAQHFLVGGDWGDENRWHSHHYRVELTLEGRTLDQHDYLVDIVDVEAALESEVARWKDTTLNDHAEFEGRNPSIELFARVLWERLNASLDLGHLDELEVMVWENEIARASYRDRPKKSTT